MPAMDTFTPSASPDYGLSAEESPRWLTNTFGEGYKADAPDGLNPVAMSCSPTWTLLTASQSTTMLSFMRSHIGRQFYWTVPGEGIARKWVATKWKRDVAGPAYFTVQIWFEERF